MPAYCDGTERRILGCINPANMDEVLKKFDTIDRLSGSAGELEAIRFITEKLASYGISFEEHVFASYLSNPISASLTVLGENNVSIPAKTRAFSADCPEGVEGELVYAPAKGGIQFDTAVIPWMREQVEGKIIISEGGGPQHMDRAAELGALGLIHVWPSGEDVIHEMTASAVWGVPTPDTARLLPTIPEISVKKTDGEKLIAWAKDQHIRVKMTAVLEAGVKTLHLPVASIPGKSEDYVLLAGHIDSWYVGVTDNAVGNALCLELARAFKEHQGELNRSIKVAWWPGHSNGRYAGSTWYCDNAYEDLRRHCVAYINADSPGSKFGVIPLVRSTLIEKDGYFQQAVRDVSGTEPQWDFPIRAGDNSMWGAFIPFHLMLRDKPDRDHNQAHVGGSGGGWWWHSEEDTYDKADLELLARDARIFASFAYRIMAPEILPVDFLALAARMEGILKGYAEKGNPAFDMSKALHKTEAFRNAARAVADSKPSDPIKLNRLYKNAGGRLMALMYTTVGPYEQDVAYDLKPFHGFYRVSGLNHDNTAPDMLLFHETAFRRQYNRFLTEMDEVIGQMEEYIGKASYE